MPQNQTEADWKRFSKNLELLRNEYLVKQNKILVAILMDPMRDPTACFWDSVKKQEDIQKNLRACLDEFSRSNLTEKVLLTVQCDMMSQEFLSGFSKGFQELVRRRLDFRRELSSEESIETD